jgi:hypothetical protein
MARMVQAAHVGDVTEAEIVHAMLRDAGIEAEIQTQGADDPLVVMVPEESLDDAKDAIDAMTSDDLLGEL